MRYIISLFLLLLLFSCDSEKKKIVSPKEKFDKLENIFSTANWKVTESADTSYLYFSRLGDLNYTVYDYKLVKGDSSINEISHIGYINNEVSWMRSADTLQLAAVDSASAIWNARKDDKMVYTFKKLSDSTVSMTFQDNKQVLLKKTLSLATFLVRSKYDYIHNTHTVDSPLVPHRGRDLP